MLKLSAIATIILLLFLTIWVAIWKSPGVNPSGEKSIHKCIHDDNKKLYRKLAIGKGKYFDVYLVKNSKPHCLNPYFPAIHIQASGSHNAWVHIIYTDSKVRQLKVFIDAEKDTYPFYTYMQDFYDAPLWSYSLLNKPLSFWKGHAFAVKVDHNKKVINCISGIKWGFELSLMKLRPKAINPKLLDRQDWEQAWLILQEKLPGYQQTYG